ncbi:hypothetical protein KP509_35G051000 [Ceratopteris richardii]|uniref:C2 domain-containing protein n=1 Tax=Ceratopteris richardii TaxID=49495 RepID=A0A8T2QFJ3_CERRI|nr:hypothetical protein KP509_35G051000 [Ceratopteris richardii]
MAQQRRQNYGYGVTRNANGRAQKWQEIELMIMSAQDLKRPWLQLGRMKAYAVVYVDGLRGEKEEAAFTKKEGTKDDERVAEKGNEREGARTRVDEHGGENPVWNDVVRVKAREEQLRKGSLTCLTVDIYSRRAAGQLFACFAGDVLVGSVRILLSGVIKDGGGGGAASAAPPNPIHCLACWVRLPSGDPHGILNVWIPPSGRFLRRQMDSQEFRRTLAWPSSSNSCSSPSPPKCSVSSNCSRTDPPILPPPPLPFRVPPSSSPDVSPANSLYRPHGPPYEEETFIFDV